MVAERTWSAVTGLFARGREGAAARLQAAALPDRPRRRRRVPHATPVSCPTRDHRRPRGRRRPHRPSGAEYTALRPTLEDFVVEMPRGAQVIYPKDLGPICMLADIGPGVRVLRERRRLGRAVDDDAALGRRDRRLRDPRGLRQPGPQERARVSSARRHSIATRSTSVTATRGSTPPTDRSTGSCSTFPSRGRWCPTPSRCCPPAGCSSPTRRRSRRPHRSARSLKGKWIDGRTIEVLHRGWHIEGQAVRPDHRMVAHTGFLSVARFLGRNES